VGAIGARAPLTGPTLDCRRGLCSFSEPASRQLLDETVSSRRHSWLRNGSQRGPLTTKVMNAVLVERPAWCPQESTDGIPPRVAAFSPSRIRPYAGRDIHHSRSAARPLSLPASESSNSMNSAASWQPRRRLTSAPARYRGSSVAGYRCYLDGGSAGTGERTHLHALIHCKGIA